MTMDSPTNIRGLFDPTTLSPIILGALTNRTINTAMYNTNTHRSIATKFPQNISDDSVINDVITRQKLSTVTSSLSSLIVTTFTSTTESPRQFVIPESSDSTTLAKITALLVITAIVLVISYRFVVRLFLGYTDRKDDVYPDGFSDEDEDSAVVKRLPERYIEIG